MDGLFPAFDALRQSLAGSGKGLAAEVYGLEELLALAGERLGEEITPRTVRLYATQGLIDRPGREGRSAVYGRRHLLQLLLIRSLARRGLSLAAIAPLIGLPDDELEQQLVQLEGDGGPVSGPQAAMAADLQAAGSEERNQEGNEALAYLRGLQSAASAEVAAVGTDPTASPPAGDASSLERSASLLPLLGSPLFSRSSSRSSLSPSVSASISASISSSRSPSRSGGSREAASRWHRFTLAPGVELQISDSVSIPPPGSRRRSWLNRLIARLLELLEDSPP